MEESKETINYKIDNKPRLLKADEIECRVGTINAKGCSLLLYKDARVDMKILDETYGVGNWQRTHEVINGNLFCTIEVWNDRISQWVKKQDVGTESYTEKEKGEASDSFKRAGFNVGIGRELYTSPFIWIMPKAEMKPYNTKDIDGNEASEFYAYKKDGYNKNVYTKKTVFIPVNGWEYDKTKYSLYDYLKVLNPISVFYKKMKLQINDLHVFDGIDFIFFGKNGYFKMNTSNITERDWTKYIRMIKALEENEAIDDSDESDNSADGIATSIIDKIETNNGIKIHSLTGEILSDEDRQEMMDDLDERIDDSEELKTEFADRF